MIQNCPNKIVDEHLEQLENAIFEDKFELYITVILYSQRVRYCILESYIYSKRLPDNEIWKTSRRLNRVWSNEKQGRFSNEFSWSKNFRGWFEIYGKEGANVETGKPLTDWYMYRRTSSMVKRYKSSQIIDFMGRQLENLWISSPSTKLHRVVDSQLLYTASKNINTAELFIFIFISNHYKKGKE